MVSATDDTQRVFVGCCTVSLFHCFDVCCAALLHCFTAALLHCCTACLEYDATNKDAMSNKLTVARNTVLEIIFCKCRFLMVVSDVCWINNGSEP